MASIVCQQGLQSSLETQFVEPRIFGLKLAPPPKPLFLQSLEWAAVSVPTTLDSNIKDDNNKNDVDNNETITNVNNDNGGWDFIQALENSSKNYIKEAKKETPYVHPLVKSYSSKLSEKSLELCTENLGCETGSDIGEYSDVYSNSSDSEYGKSVTRDRPSFRRNSSLITNNNNNNNKKKKVMNNCGGNLPPPLTSISGSNCIQVIPHREDGRLVIKTVVVPSSQSCFKAERRDGRLRLHFVNNYDSNQSFKQEQVEEEKQEAETDSNEPEVDEAEDEPEMDEAEEEDIFFGEDMDGNNWNGGGEMGIEKFQRPSRCKEGGGRGKNGLLIWEPFWVAT